jgi:hypothetical protein
VLLRLGDFTADKFLKPFSIFELENTELPGSWQLPWGPLDTLAGFI